MRLFGLEIRKAWPTLSPVGENRSTGWVPWIREPYAGAWQQNVEWTTDTVLAHHAVFACITLISADIGKLRPKLVQQDANGIWDETTSPAFSPVLRHPNRYQNHIQFKEWWTTSKLIRGNAYALKVRDARGLVIAEYLLDPCRVQVLVAPDGSVFYQLGQDNLSGLETVGVTVPASEIIHDRINCLFHPLVGVSPIFACGLAAMIGLNIEQNGAKFFGQGSNPSGVLTGPKQISEVTAKRLKESWDSGFTGDNAGKVAVLGEGLTFEPLRMSAVDSQTIEHLKWTAETVCSCFHVPPWKIGIGPMPAANVETLNQIYYSDCLQSHIENWELCQDEGLGLTAAKDGKTYGVELDLDGLLRMDGAAQMKVLAEGIGGSVLTPNEARKRVDKKPLEGGDTVYMQQQNFSLAALNERDQDKPFAKPATPPPTPDTAGVQSTDSERTASLAAFALKVADGLRKAAA